MRRAALLAVPVLAAGLLLGGCAEQGTEGTNLTSEVIQQWDHPVTEAVTFSGTTVDGQRFDSADHRGKVLVVNFWYAGCNPCRAEAPILKKLAAKWAGEGVQFVGVDTIDDRQTAAGFDRTFSPGYPSIVDSEDRASVQLAFAGSRGPNATPTTLILDRKGQVVARYSGLVNESNLDTLIGDAVDGRSA